MFLKIILYSPILCFFASCKNTVEINEKVENRVEIYSIAIDFFLMLIYFTILLI